MGKFVVEYPQLAVEFISTVDGDDNVSDYTSGSGVKAVWQCNKADHVYETSFRRRVYGATCPYCSGRKVLKGFNDVATTHSHIVDEWVDENVSPYEVSAGSNKPVLWKCGEGHETVLSVKEKLKTKTCAECAGRKTITKKRSNKMGKKMVEEDKELMMKNRVELFRPENNDLHVIESFHEWVKTSFVGYYQTPDMKDLGKLYDYYFPAAQTIIIVHKIFYPRLVGLQTFNYVQLKHEWFTRCGYTVLPFWEDQILHSLDKVKTIITNHVKYEAYRKETFKVKISNPVEAETFHNTHSLDSFVEAERHYIVYNSDTGETVAMFSTNVEDIEHEDGNYFKAHVVNFTAVKHHVEHFTELTSYVSSLWGNNVEYVIDLSESQKHYLRSTKFVEETSMEPKWVLNADTLTRESTEEEHGNYTEKVYRFVQPPVVNVDSETVTHF